MPSEGVLGCGEGTKVKYDSRSHRNQLSLIALKIFYFFFRGRREQIVLRTPPDGKRGIMYFYNPAFVRKALQTDAILMKGKFS